MKKELLELIDRSIELAREDLKSDIIRLISVKSVKGTPEPGAPFGRDPRNMLDAVLKMGVPQPSLEWGAMLSGGRDFIRDYSYMTFFPGLAIMITILAVNLVGDGLRDAMDPKLKR